MWAVAGLDECVEEDLVVIARPVSRINSFFRLRETNRDNMNAGWCATYTNKPIVRFHSIAAELIYFFIISHLKV